MSTDSAESIKSLYLSNRYTIWHLKYYLLQIMQDIISVKKCEKYYPFKYREKYLENVEKK